MIPNLSPLQSNLLDLNLVAMLLMQFSMERPIVDSTRQKPEKKDSSESTYFSSPLPPNPHPIPRFPCANDNKKQENLGKNLALYHT